MGRKLTDKDLKGIGILCPAMRKKILSFEDEEP